MTELPPSWSHTELAAVVDLIRGVTYKKEQSRRAPEPGFVPVLGARNIGTSLNLSEHLVWVPESVVSDAQYLREGDIVIATSSGSSAVVGKSAPFGGGWRGAFGAFCAVARPRPGVDAAYLAHFIASARVRQKWSELAAGTSINNLKREHLTSTRVPLAPLAEQRRIVEAIDEQVSRLDAAEMSIARLLRQLPRLDASCLHTLIDEVDAPRIQIAQLAHLVTDGDHNPPRRVASGIPHLTAKHVKSGSLVLEGASFVSAEGFEQTRRRYDPREGDVIVSCVGTIGQTAVVPRGLTFSADRNLAAVRPMEGVDSGFLRLALAAPRAQRLMRSASGSTAQPHLYLRELRSLDVKLPSLEVQRLLVRQLDEHFSRTRAFQSSIEQARRRSTVLRKAVLSSAFSGRLVPQDEADEPASALLERIRGERETTAAAKSLRKVRA